MWAVLVGWATAAEPTAAQIRVVVFDANEEPLTGVPVMLDGQSLLSDAWGEALFPTEPGPHTLTVWLPGQPPVIQPVTALVNRTLLVSVDPSWTPRAPVSEPSAPALTPELLQSIPVNRSGSPAVAPPLLGVRVGTSWSVECPKEPPASIIVERPRRAEATWDGCVTVRGLKPGRTWIWTTGPDGIVDWSAEIVVTEPDGRR